MIFLWIFLGIVSLLFLFAMLSAHLVLEYREELTLTFRVLFFKRTLIPTKQKKTRLTKSKKKHAKPTKKVEANKGSTNKPKGILEKLTELRGVLSELLERTLGHLSIRTARIRIRVATGDAASTAVLFGAVNGGVVLLLELLDRFGKLKTKSTDEIEVFPDYLSEKTEINVRIFFSLRVWQILCILWKTFVTTKTKNKK